MRLQRYPDGANKWCLFIWSRHPRWSLTWTHSLTLTRPRPGNRRWLTVYRIPRLTPAGQSRYGIACLGFDLELATQAALAALEGK
jgi:hypothetical protein